VRIRPRTGEWRTGKHCKFFIACAAPSMPGPHLDDLLLERRKIHVSETQGTQRKRLVRRKRGWIPARAAARLLSDLVAIPLSVVVESTTEPVGGVAVRWVIATSERQPQEPGDAAEFAPANHAPLSGCWAGWIR
jgi:hypothetical protein